MKISVKDSPYTALSELYYWLPLMSIHFFKGGRYIDFPMTFPQVKDMMVQQRGLL